MGNGKISSNQAIDAALHLDGDPDRVRSYYDAWAQHYNRDVTSAGYSGPAICARLLRQFRNDDGILVLDAGCGTGLVGIELRRLGYTRVDGFDLSESMAGEARACGCYREVRGAVDMMQATQVYGAAGYDALLSVGVFTPGHVAPEALHELLRLCRAGGLLVISTRSQYYEQTGFQRVIDEILARRRAALLLQEMNAPYNLDGDGHYWVLEKS